MVEHHSIVGEGKTYSISCIEFIIANDIFILWVLTGDYFLEYSTIPRVQLHSHSSAQTSIKQEEDTKIWWNCSRSDVWLGTFFHGHVWERPCAGLLQLVTRKSQEDKKAMERSHAEQLTSGSGQVSKPCRRHLESDWLQDLIGIYLCTWQLKDGNSWNIVLLYRHSLRLDNPFKNAVT